SHVAGGQRRQRRHVELRRIARLRDGLAVLVDHEHGLRVRVSMKDFADPVDLLQLLLVHDELLDHRALAPGPRKWPVCPRLLRPPPSSHGSNPPKFIQRLAPSIIPPPYARPTPAGATSTCRQMPAIAPPPRRQPVAPQRNSGRSTSKRPHSCRSARR